MEEISKIDRNIANEAEQNWIRYRPRIIFNKCNLPGELDIVPSIENHFKQNLLLKGDYFGCLFTDAAVTRAFQERKTLKNVEPYSHILEDIHILADRITRKSLNTILVRYWIHSLTNYQERYRSYVKIVNHWLNVIINY